MPSFNQTPSSSPEALAESGATFESSEASVQVCEHEAAVLKEVEVVEKAVGQMIASGSKEVVSAENSNQGSITVSGNGEEVPRFVDMSKMTPSALAESLYRETEGRFGNGSVRPSMVMAQSLAA